MMNYKGKHVLILEGYARQCLPLMRLLKKHGCEVSLLCNSKLDIGYVSRLPDNRILGICDPNDLDGSERFICDLIEKQKFDLVIPLVDFSASILSKNKEKLSKYSFIASNDRDVFVSSQDKLNVMSVCMENNIPCPKTLTQVNSFYDVLKSGITFPIVVKPRRGCGGRGFKCLKTPIALADSMEEISVSDSVIQEYIPQTDRNLSANLFIDNNGKVKAAYVYRSLRWYPLKGGTGTFNQIEQRDDVIEVAKKISKLLNLRGWVGVDLIDDPRDGIAKVIEVNPRILACAKIGVEAGIDIALPILQSAFDHEVKCQVTLNENVRVRMSQTDFLWFVRSKDRFRVKPSWFSFKNTKDQTFSLDDPLPWFAFLIRGMILYKNEMEKRR